MGGAQILLSRDALHRQRISFEERDHFCRMAEAGLQTPYRTLAATILARDEMQLRGFIRAGSDPNQFVGFDGSDEAGLPAIAQCVWKSFPEGAVALLEEGADPYSLIYSDPRCRKPFLFFIVDMCLSGGLDLEGWIRIADTMKSLDFDFNRPRIQQMNIVSFLLRQESWSFEDFPTEFNYMHKYFLSLGLQE